jgi:DNA-binding NarL/FixJ family response regulator
VKGNVGEREVVDALRAVAAGRSYFCSISQKVRIELLDESPQASTPLTPRQMSIAKLVAMGKTSQTIADELNLSPRTVENHRAEILRKLNLRNAADLAVYVKEQGW